MSDDTRSVPTTSNAADETAFRSLAGVVDTDVDGFPLDYACEHLSRLAGVPIWIDPRGIFGLGILSDEEVAIPPAARTLGGTLDEMLPAGMGYYIQGGQIVITAADEAERRVFTRIYRTRPKAAPTLCDQLLNGLGTSSIAAHYWSTSGGLGEVTAIADDWIVVTADAVRQGMIKDWLAEIRTGKTPRRAAERRALEKERQTRPRYDPFQLLEDAGP